MTNPDILATISQTLADVLELDKVSLTRDSNAADFADWDSINHVRLLIALESAFGISFGTSEVGMIDNVGQLVDLIQSKLAKARK